MTDRKQVATRSLRQADMEQIERLLYKNSDDIAVSIARWLERLEERVEAAQARLYSRVDELSDQIAEGTHKEAASIR